MTIGGQRVKQKNTDNVHRFLLSQNSQYLKN